MILENGFSTPKSKIELPLGNTSWRNRAVIAYRLLGKVFSYTAFIVFHSVDI